jgi:hypothetical protein
MLKKIISGGQTGADRAALDVAINLEIPHGGWVPKGRLAEDGQIPERYHLQEITTPSYEQRTERNVVDSDGTLILSHGPLAGGSAYTQAMAIKHKKPWLHIDLIQTDAFCASLEIESWISENRIEVLNIAGPRESKDQNIYQATKDILEVVLHIIRFDINIPSYIPFLNFRKKLDMSKLPKAVEDVVDLLISDLSTKEKVLIAKMKEEDIHALNTKVAPVIKTEFKLDTGNEELLKSCSEIEGKDTLNADEAAGVILGSLWNQIRAMHKMRLIK